MNGRIGEKNVYTIDVTKIELKTGDVNTPGGVFKR
jgi:hypothetical protein